MSVSVAHPQHVNVGKHAPDYDYSPSTAKKVRVSKSAKAAAAAAIVKPPPSRWTAKCHPRVVETTAEVDGDFLARWGFSDQRAKDKFVDAGFSRVTCLYFPESLDDRIHFACRLLTILFLIDGELSFSPLFLRGYVADGVEQTSSRTCPSRMGRNTITRSCPSCAATRSPTAPSPSRP